MVDENGNGINLAGRMANVGTQLLKTNSVNEEVNNNNSMEENYDNDSINSNNVIQSIAINPRAFTFQQITKSPTEAAMRKLTHIEGQAVHHI